MMRSLLIFLILAGTLAVSACAVDNGEGLYENAQFEELQNNPEHAKKLYKEIIEKYPESEYAGKARARMSELSKE
jgi:outer membrane protein assembly factor BamD (BamD/ComL family)